MYKINYFEQWILILKNVEHRWCYQEYVIEQFNTICQESITRSVYLVLGWWVNPFAWINWIPRDWFLSAPRSRTSLWLAASTSWTEFWNGEFKKLWRPQLQKYTYFYKIVYWINSLFCWYSCTLIIEVTYEWLFRKKKSRAGLLTGAEEGEYICPRNKIVQNVFDTRTLL